MLVSQPYETFRTRSGQRPAQQSGEFGPFLRFLKEIKVRSYLEVGSRYGDAFWEVGAQVAPQRMVAIDLPGAAWGRADSKPMLEGAIAALRERNIDARALFGNSRHPLVINKARTLGPYDAVFIDGDHAYEGVKADWLTYMPMATKIVAFHDILGGRPGSGVEVDRLWAEIKAEGYRTHEFTAPGSLMGIGVVFLTQQVPDAA